MAEAGTRPAMRVLAAFEGGGAKGLAHVGAVRALEEAGVRFTGLAGTSAGAIVAALVAAGYRSGYLADMTKKPPTTILDRLAEISGNAVCSATGLLGARSWFFVSSLRFFLRRPFLLLLPAFAFFAGALELGRRAAGQAPHLAAVIPPDWLPAAALTLSVLVPFLVLAGGAYLLVRLLQGGLASPQPLIDNLETLLGAKVFPDLPHGTRPPVLFSHFGGAGPHPTLKIVATDVTHGEVRLFSPETTPGVRVAEAVAASACLPVVFRPVLIGKRLHFDGGLMSNLPAWTFDVERTLDCDALTFAFEIVDDPEPAATPVSRFGWLYRLVYAVIFSRAFLNKRAIARIETIRLPVAWRGKDAVGVLDFDVDIRRVGKIVADAHAVTQSRVAIRFGTERQVYLDAGTQVLGLVHTAFERTPSILGEMPPAPRLRVALALPEGSDADAHAPHRDRRAVSLLRLRRELGYDPDTDERIDLPLIGSVVGEVWRSVAEDGSAAYRLERFRDAAGKRLGEDFGLSAEGDRIRRKLVWKDLAFVLAIPILNRQGRIEFVVSIDGNMPLRDEAPEFEATFDKLAEETYAVYSDALERLRAALADDPRNPAGVTGV